MYLTIHKYFHKDRISLKYSEHEDATACQNIRHKYFRQCLSDFHINGVEITSVADIPAGRGLGSSSSFTVALLHLLHTYRGEYISKYKLAKEACEVEIEKLGEPVGKQDQYAAAFGGLNFYEFLPSGFVNIEPIIMKKESYRRLEQNLMMFYLGGVHSASEILKEQSENLQEKEKARMQIEMCHLARTLKEEFQKNNVDAAGELLHENWMLKKTLADGITNPWIDDVYEHARNAGAAGGKLLGAGGAGFMLFYVPENRHGAVRKALSEFRELHFEMDNAGASIIYVDKDFG